MKWRDLLRSRHLKPLSLFKMSWGALSEGLEPGRPAPLAAPRRWGAIVRQGSAVEELRWTRWSNSQLWWARGEARGEVTGAFQLSFPRRAETWRQMQMHWQLKLLRIPRRRAAQSCAELRRAVFLLQKEFWGADPVAGAAAGASQRKQRLCRGGSHPQQAAGPSDLHL